MSGRWSDLLARHGLQPGKRLGQHFLFDGGILGRIAAAAEIRPGDLLLEVGPGVGSLTATLVAQGAAVLAVEKDPRLAPALAEALEESAGPGDAAVRWPVLPSPVAFTDIGPQVRVLWADAVRLPWAELARADANWRLCSNLPYYLTGPFLAAFFASGLRWSSAVLLVQAEAGARMTARPGTPAYGAFSCLVQYHAVAERLFAVPRGSFVPPPAVESCVVRLRPHAVPPVAALRAAFLRVVRAAFGQRRKTLLNALAAGLACDREDVRAALAAAGLDPERRGETLSLAEFDTLTAALRMAGRLE